MTNEENLERNAGILKAAFVRALSPYVSGLTEDKITVTEFRYEEDGLARKDREFNRRFTGREIRDGVQTVVQFSEPLGSEVAQALKESLDEVTNVWSAYNDSYIGFCDDSDAMVDRLDQGRLKMQLSLRLG